MNVMSDMTRAHFPHAATQYKMEDDKNQYSSLPHNSTTPTPPLAQVKLIYNASIAHLRESLQAFVAGEDIGNHVRACYPFVRVQYAHGGPR